MEISICLRFIGKGKVAEKSSIMPLEQGNIRKEISSHHSVGRYGSKGMTKLDAVC